MYYHFLFIFLIIFNTVLGIKKPITIGLLNEPFYNLAYSENESLNDIIKKLFTNELKLDVEFKEVSYKELKKLILEKSIDGVALIPKDYLYKNHLTFSESIYSEELFVVSQTKNISSLEELDNKIIYTPYIESYKKIFESILDNNDLKSYLTPVEDLNLYKDKIILTSTPALYKPEHGINVSKSPGIAIGLIKEHEKLVLRINEALKNNYRKIFFKKIEKLNEDIAFKNFYSSLTEEEKDYLNNLSSFKIVYEDSSNTIVSYKSEIDGKYKGIAPNILKKISENLNIKFVDIADTNINSIEDFKNKEIDIMLLSKTQNRLKDFIFSRKIYDLGVYVISLENDINSNRNIGVIKGSVEEDIARRYDVKSNIISFENYNLMIKALNEGKVGNLLVIDKDKENLDCNKYKITFFESVPINFSFNKDNLILKNIFDKAFKYVINIPKMTDMAILERELENKIQYQKSKSIKNMMICFFIFFILIILMISLYLYREKVIKKKLLKDSLTGLCNRFVFDEFCKNYNYLSGYTFVIDLNNFKKINDFFGHEMGDVILKEFGNFLKIKFKKEYIFRISGDEFYGFSFNPPEKIIEKLKEYKEYCPTLKKYKVTYNLGISPKSSKKTLAIGFRYADLAMLETKKDKDLFYKIADNKFLDKVKRENFIRDLLKDNISGIYPVYQPKFCLKSHKIIGAEALARYELNEIGSISPSEFIPIAEKYNFIHRVDYKIAEESIFFVSKLAKEGKNLQDFRISFNLSITTFKRSDLISIISGLLDNFNVSGKNLEIEITESIFILDMKDLVTKIEQLKKLGIQISLDDFTAGHSTAGLLPLLPIDIVKLDKSLLDSVEKNKEKGKSVFRNLTALIKDLNFKIVAEGIENSYQVEFLKKLNIDYGQGFYFNRPITEEKFLKNLE